MHTKFIIFLVVIILFSCAKFLSVNRSPSSEKINFNQRVTPTIEYDWRAHTNDDYHVVNIFNLDVLESLEKKGLSINSTFFPRRSSDWVEGEESKTSLELYQENDYYRVFSEQLGKKETPHDNHSGQLIEPVNKSHGDIPEMVRIIQKKYDKGGKERAPFTIGSLANNSHYPYKVKSGGDEPRHFDQRWLYSPIAKYKLVSIANRMDKKDQYPNSCGEVRFIYRLMYSLGTSLKDFKSSLPFFVNVVYEYPKDDSGCENFARTWIMEPSFSRQLQSQSWKQSVEDFSERIFNSSLADLEFKQVEVNFQALRFTSFHMTDLGGQAMYMQRIFAMRDGEFRPIALENTPNVINILNDLKENNVNNSLLNDLAEKIKENIYQIDLGTGNLEFEDKEKERKILNDRAISWSTLGRARSANKPFRELFLNHKNLLPSDYEIKNKYKLKYISSTDGLIERLDNMTCMGCHQSGGTAGFHALGYAANDYSHRFNKQQLPLSAHNFAEIGRKQAFIKALASGREPNSFRPHSITPPSKNWEVNGMPDFEDHKVRDLCFSKSSPFNGVSRCAAFKGQDTECRRTVTGSRNEVSTLIGECVLVENDADRFFAGGSCYKTMLNEEVEKQNFNYLPTYNFMSFLDNSVYLKHRSSPHPRCGHPKGGAPLARRSRNCSYKEEKFYEFGRVVLRGKNIDDYVINNFKRAKRQGHRDPLSEAIPIEVCASRGGNGFDRCAARGDAGNCLENIVNRSNLDTCYPGHFCREDFICQMIPDYHLIPRSSYENSKNFAKGKYAFSNSDRKLMSDSLSFLRDSNEIGFCVPTYFLFNMRADGHVNPLTGKAYGAIKYNYQLNER